MNDDSKNTNGTKCVYVKRRSEDTDLVNLKFNPPVPSKPNLNVDNLQLPSPVFSEKVKNALEKLNIEQFELIPAIINGRLLRKYKGFLYCRHIQ